MEMSILVSGLITKSMEKEQKPGKRLVLSMKGSGMLMTVADGVGCTMLMDQFMKENGMMTSETDKECCVYPMRTVMKGNGEMIRKMAMESFIILTVVKYMKECGWMAYPSVDQ